MKYFGTLFDKNYLTRGLALYNSMINHVDDFKLFVLCLDEDTFDYFQLRDLKHIEPIRLKTIEDEYKDLNRVKPQRNIVEYYFTLSPIFPLYLLEKYPEISFITTIDADIYFYSTPQSIFDEFENYSIMITAHDFPYELNQLESYGKFNVSFQSFRRDDEGLACLRYWKNQCIEWCKDYLEEGKFADQKYLDDWTEKYSKVQIIQGKGAGIAPWNISKYRLKKNNNVVYCDENPLIFFHFHGLRFLSNKLVIHGLKSYDVISSKFIKNHVYKEYIFLLTDLQSNIVHKDNLITRNSGGYSTMEKLNYLKANQTYFNLFNIYLLNNNFSAPYRIMKFFLYPIYKFIKKIWRKL
jgi:hypothetical protein